VNQPAKRRKAFATILQIVGGLSTFVFLNPWFESTYFGDGDRRVVHVSSGLPSSPWLTYDSDSGRDTKTDGSAQSDTHYRAAVYARSWSWPFLAAGVVFLLGGARVARAPRVGRG
jgi:hypothetical protein